MKKISEKHEIIKNLEPLEDSPSLLQMAKNFSSSMTEWVKNGFNTVSKEQYLFRMEICKACEHWKEDARLGLGKCNHSKCGCTRVKQWLSTEKCPINKWDKIES